MLFSILAVIGIQVSGKIALNDEMEFYLLNNFQTFAQAESLASDTDLNFDLPIAMTISEPDLWTTTNTLTKTTTTTLKPKLTETILNNEACSVQSYGKKS